MEPLQASGMGGIHIVHQKDRDKFHIFRSKRCFELFLAFRFTLIDSGEVGIAHFSFPFPVWEVRLFEDLELNSGRGKARVEFSDGHGNFW